MLFNISLIKSSLFFFINSSAMSGSKMMENGMEQNSIINFKFTQVFVQFPFHLNKQTDFFFLFTVQVSQNYKFEKYGIFNGTHRLLLHMQYITQLHFPFLFFFFNFHFSFRYGIYIVYCTAFGVQLPFHALTLVISFSKIIISPRSICNLK